MIENNEVRLEPGSAGPEPTQAALDELLDRATRVRVREPVPTEGEECQVFLETEHRGDLVALREALRIRDGGIGHCMCDGTVLFELSNEKGIVGEVSLHHGVSVRWRPLFSNAALLSPGPVLDWLADRGVTFPREEYESDLEEDAKWEEAAERWREAMPVCLKPYWDEMQQDPGCRDEYVQTIEHMYPNPTERARLLLSWYGKGQGPWSGFPSYEEVPEQMLLRIPLASILKALEPERDDATTEGAARLFGGWNFSRVRPRDLKELPRELKRQLLQHSLRSSDEDKCARARAAFA